jgi:hypothetical protein
MNGSAPHSERAPAQRSSDRHGGRPWLLIGVRYVLPAVVIIAGIVVMSLGSETDLEGGGGIVSAGLAIILINWLFRAGIAGEREREREDAAREYFDRHGRWPDERR